MARFLIDNVSDLKDMVNELCKYPRLAHDTETKGPSGIGGLFPFHGSRSFSHIFATDKDEYYVDFNRKINPKYKRELQPIFDDNTRIIFYVNAIFDGSISHFDGLTFNQRILDCPSIARVEYNRHRSTGKLDDESFLSMKYLAEYYGVQKKNDLIEKYIIENDLYQKNGNDDYILSIFNDKKIPEYDRVPAEMLFNYGCDDARTTYDLGTKILKCINQKDIIYNPEIKLITVAQREIKLTSALLKSHIAGIKLDNEYVDRAIERETIIFQNYSRELESLTNGINLNSTKQLGDFLTHHGIEVPRKELTETSMERARDYERKADEYHHLLAKEAPGSRKFLSLMRKRDDLRARKEKYDEGNYSLDSKMLGKICDANPQFDFLKMISKAKKAEKKLNTYYKNFKILQDSNGFIHANLNQAAAITGRFSCSNPNLQNLHKEKWKDDEGNIINEFLIRKSFIPDSPEYMLVFLDYKQQEMIVMLDQAGEMDVINKLLSGEVEDFYIATALVLFEILGIEINRKDAKAMALGLAYGKGLELLARELGYIGPNSNDNEILFGKEKAKLFKTQFFNALKKLQELTKKLEYEVITNGKIHNAFGRVIYLDKNEAYKALNAYVQSTSADITKQAIVNIEPLLRDKKSRFVLSVHDENIFCLHKSELYLIEMLKEEMSKAYKYKHIPLGVDCEYSEKSWGEKENYVA